MANRHLARSVVLQTIFEWDYSNFKKNFLNDALKRNVLEYASGLEEDEFMMELLNIISSKREVIDDIIEKAAPDWPIDKISVVDRNILRLGLAELLFGDRTNVPPKVAINEAIELAKTFGGDNSGRFINGVLGAVYKEIGEPGKEQTTSKKDDDVDLSKIPTDEKSASVVFAENKGKYYFAMVHDVFGFWTLSKGSVGDNESGEDAAVRSLKEETGLEIKIIKKMGENEYIANHPQRGKVRKHVTYYLAKAKYKDIVLDVGTGGLDDAKWFPIEDVENLRMYEDVVPLLVKSIEYIHKV